MCRGIKTQICEAPQLEVNRKRPKGTREDMETLRLSEKDTQDSEYGETKDNLPTLACQDKWY